MLIHSSIQHLLLSLHIPSQSRFLFFIHQDFFFFLRILETAQLRVNFEKIRPTQIMNRPRRVKEEFLASSSSFSGGAPPPTAAPQPMERLHEAGPPPFLTKTYEIIEDTTTNHIVSWSRGNNSFVVWDPQSFSLSLLPKYFKHSNFSSFVRQLNTYVSSFLLLALILILLRLLAKWVLFDSMRKVN